MRDQKRKVQVVVIAENEVLLLKTNEQRGLFWQNLTGGVDTLEEISVAAKREAEEELGIQLTNYPEKLPFEFSYTHSDRGTFNEYCFVLKFDSKFQPVLDPHEHVDFRWVALDKIKSDNYQYESNYQAFLAACHWLTK